MKKATPFLCAAAMTLTTAAADAASPLRPTAVETPSVLHQVGDRRGFYGGRGYHRRGFYRGGFGGYYGGYRHYDNFWVPGAAFIAGAIIGGVIANRYEPEYRPIYRPYRPIYRPHRVYRPYRAYRSYPVYDYSYGPCNSWRQDC